MSEREPMKAEQADPLWNAIWNIIKGWDIRKPGQNAYWISTGTDVCEIYDAVFAQAQASLAAARAEALEVLEFYADPETYFAIGFFQDSPCGEFMKDFSETECGMKPGKRARAALDNPSDSTALAKLRNDQIKHMVNRFLSWRLPENFNPDAGISFKATFNEHTAHPMKHEPTGTNLFEATQAEEMVRHLLDGMPGTLPCGDVAKLLAEERLALIESFGLMLADAEISCGQKHSAQFSALSKLRDIALAARVAELKGEQR